MNRRTLLTGSALALVTPLIDACSSSGTTTTPTVTVAQVVSVAQNADATLLQEFSILTPSLSPAQQGVVAKIQAALTDAGRVLKPLSTTMAGNQALPGIQQAEQDFNAVVVAVSMVPLPPPYSTAVAALALSLPILEGFINTYVPTASASMAMLSARRTVILATDRVKAQAMADRWGGK